MKVSQLASTVHEHMAQMAAQNSSHTSVMARVTALEAKIASLGSASGQLDPTLMGQRLADMEKQVVKLSARCVELEEAQTKLSH